MLFASLYSCVRGLLSAVLACPILFEVLKHAQTTAQSICSPCNIFGKFRKLEIKNIKQMIERSSFSIIIFILKEFHLIICFASIQIPILNAIVEILRFSSAMLNLEFSSSSDQRVSVLLVLLVFPPLQTDFIAWLLCLLCTVLDPFL